MTGGRPRKYDNKTKFIGITTDGDLADELEKEAKEENCTKSEYCTTILMMRNQKDAGEIRRQNKELKELVNDYRNENIELRKKVEELSEKIGQQNNHLERIGTKAESGGIFIKAPEIPEIKEYIQSQKYEISQKVRRFNDKGINPLTHMDGLVDSYYADFIDHEKTKGTIVNEKEMQSIKMSIRRELIDIIGR